MTFWHELKQGQQLIVEKAIFDVEHTPEGATVWVQGCAGTGKTLVLAHIAQRLAAIRADRKIAFLTYTHALKEIIKTTVTDGSVPVDVLTYKYYLYQKSKKSYEIIFIDEIQDISKNEILQLKAHCKHLIVAGDCEQRIYEQGSSEPEIDQIASFDKYRLVGLFRVTKSIVDWAKKLLPSTLLVSGEEENQMDIDIAARSFDSPQQEARWVYDEAIAFARPRYPSAILFPTHTEIYEFCRLLASDFEISSSGPKVEIADSGRDYRIADYKQLNAHFYHHQIPCGYLGNGIGELSKSNSRPFVYLMTYYSAKGLDFSNVFLPRLVSDIQIGVSHNGLERALFFVAVTRARERLVVTYTGSKPYSLVRLIPNFENRIIHHNPDVNDEDEGTF